MKRCANLIVILLTAACCSCSKPAVSSKVALPAKPAATATTVESSLPLFINVAAEAGLKAVLFCGGANKDHILESVGTGAAFVDYDKDGEWDLYLVNAWALDEDPAGVRQRGRNVLYRNLGRGRFEDVTEKAGVGDDAWGCGVSAGDYDNDGHVDLYVTNFGPNRLYRNLGQGAFEEVGEKSGVADIGWGAGSAFFDADADGDLDLYVANYIDCQMDQVLPAQLTHVWRNKIRVMSGPFGMRGGRDRFFRNQGNGSFVDATDEVGMTDTAESYGLGVLASDLDHDGDVDVYVANDSNPNFLYRNNGDGKFTEVGSWTGAALSSEGAAQGSMGVDAGDLDGDGLQELFVTNFAHDHSTLYQNSGNLLFEDISAKQGLDRSTFGQMGWGCAFFDFDLDADLDLIQINGHIYPQVDAAPELKESYRQQPLLFENRNGRLVDISGQAFAGQETTVSGRGLAVADYDNDGDLDLLITAMDAPPVLLRNDAPPKGHWFKVRPLNQRGAPAVGARVHILTDGVSQMRELRSGSTYQSQNAFELHFGLGAATQIDSIEVYWPNGEMTQIEDVLGDQAIVVQQEPAKTEQRPSAATR